MNIGAKSMVWMRGVLASVISVVVFGFIWVAVQPSRTLMLTEHSIEVMEETAVAEPPVLELDESVLGADGIHEMSAPSPRERAMEEHGEVREMAVPRYKGTGERMERGEAIKRAEDLVAIRDDLNAPVIEREAAERELREHLAENFPTAAGDSRLQPTNAVPEPKNGDSYGAPSWDEILRNLVDGALPYLFMAVQGVIAWRTRKKLAEAKEIPTDSFIDRVDEKLVAKYRTKKTKVK